MSSDIDEETGKGVVPPGPSDIAGLFTDSEIDPMRFSVESLVGALLAALGAPHGACRNSGRRNKEQTHEAA